MLNISGQIGQGESYMEGINRIFFDHPAYPQLLREIPDPPRELYYSGSLPQQVKPLLALVGTRRATPAGKNAARQFAAGAARAGIVVVSGLAFGIDAAAHEGCLDAGGITLAVLACGLDAFYPKENTSLAKKILANGGAILSEYPPGERALPYRFIERNRIISGLAQGTLVIEAPADSGSIATAKFALEQNRNVYVVPGPFDHPNFAGSHELIRQGAALVVKPENILEDYGIERGQTALPAIVSQDPQEMQILSVLLASQTPVDVDKIAAMTKLEARVVARTLSFLVVDGRIREEEGGYTIER